MRELNAKDQISGFIPEAISKGLVKQGAIIHSDRGRQYASTDFRQLLRTNNLR
jgi:transposase InsO family protein